MREHVARGPGPSELEVDELAATRCGGQGEREHGVGAGVCKMKRVPSLLSTSRSKGSISASMATRGKTQRRSFHSSARSRASSVKEPAFSRSQRCKVVSRVSARNSTQLTHTRWKVTRACTTERNGIRSSTRESGPRRSR